MILDATRVLRSGLRLGNSARLSQLAVQAHDEAARALLDQIAEPLRVAARADAVVRGPAEHPSGVPGITVGIVPPERSRGAPLRTRLAVVRRRAAVTTAATHAAMSRRYRLIRSASIGAHQPPDLP